MPSAADDTEETGWKLLHGDVFRFPPHSNLFAAMVSSGLPCACTLQSASMPEGNPVQQEHRTLEHHTLKQLVVVQVGTGSQILVMTLLIFALALLSGTFHPYSRGALLSSIIVLYAITAGAHAHCPCT